MSLLTTLAPPRFRLAGRCGCALGHSAAPGLVGQAPPAWTRAAPRLMMKAGKVARAARGESARHERQGPVKVKAAVLYGPGTKYQVEEIELDPPGESEVLVRFAASGMCHSEEHLVTGALVADPSRTPGAVRQFPMIAGHEGAGAVEETGPVVTGVRAGVVDETVPGVTGLRPGDHVGTSFIPSCGTCPSCASGQQNLWGLGATL